MLINLRNAMMMEKRKPTARDCVQSGLVAMWDGIENAGWGVHSPAPVQWVDLTANGYNMTLNSGITITDDSISADGRWIAYYTAARIAFTAMSVCLRLRDSARSIMVSLPANVSNYVYFQFNPDVSLRLGIGQRGRDINDYTGIDTDASLLGKRVSVHSNYGSRVSSTRFGPYECYMNGVAQTIRTGSSYPYNNAGAYFGVGTRLSSTGIPSAGYNYGADVCRIALYSRALTAEEIARNYAIDKARFNLP